MAGGGAAAAVGARGVAAPHKTPEARALARRTKKSGAAGLLESNMSLAESNMSSKVSAAYESNESSKVCRLLSKMPWTFRKFCCRT